MVNATSTRADLIVIGAGLAGMAATVFAVNSGLKAIRVGSTVGEMLFASGALDLLGVHPVGQQNLLDDPWRGIATLSQDLPEHPYAVLGLENIRKAFSEFLGFLQTAGLSYCGWEKSNAVLATCAGTRKITYRVPVTMWPGVIGLKERRSTLIVDFEGMKDFSARQLTETMRPGWPGLQCRTLAFPYSFPGAERQNIFLAEALDIPKVRVALADAIRPLLHDTELVGMPAIFGLRDSAMVADDLTRYLGVPVFEIPTMPPSVPGLRLKETIERELQRRGAVLVAGRQAVAVKRKGRNCVGVVLQGDANQETLEAGGLVLATGRFLGGGLTATRGGIRESLLDLPVYQPLKRQDWHSLHFLDPHGHPVNRSGLEVDDQFRPLGPDGSCAYENLFAAGSVLAHQDWIRNKCGAGLAIATAYGAVRSFVKS